MHNKPDSCAGCSLYETGKGFCLGSGDPAKAKYSIILEAPGKEEIQFTLNPNPKRSFLSTKAECDEEIKIRQRDYPELVNGSIRNGAPVVGPTGLILQYWIWNKVGIRRDECFIDHVLRCLPPKGKTGAAYPTGDVRKAAELHCRQYDRIQFFRPNTVIFSLHPNGLLREVTPLPLTIKDFEKVRDFTSQGRRVLALLGGKCTQAFMRYGSNIGRWRGHFAALKENWCETYKTLFEFKKKERKKKVDEWGNPIAARRPGKKKKVSEEALSSESGAPQSNTKGISSDTSVNFKKKKTRKRAAKKISSRIQNETSDKESSAESSSNTKALREYKSV